MSRTILMKDIDLRGIPAPLVKFLEDNKSIKAHEPNDGLATRSSRTAYMNPLAKTPGREPAFVLEITDFSNGETKKLYLNVDEATQIYSIRGTELCFDVCCDIMAEAALQGRRAKTTYLPPEKIRRD